MNVQHQVTIELTAVEATFFDPDTGEDLPRLTRKYEPADLTSGALTQLAGLDWENEDESTEGCTREHYFCATFFDQSFQITVTLFDPSVENRRGWPHSLDDLDLDVDEILGKCFAEAIEAAQTREKEEERQAKERREAAAKAAEARNAELLTKWAERAKTMLAEGKTPEDVRQAVIASGEDTGSPHPQIIYNLRLQGLLPHNPKKMRAAA